MTTRARTLRRRRRDAGYTIVEVMMALGLLTTGIVGIVAMEKTSILGNASARNLDAARTVASTWIERLRADGVAWTDAGGMPNIGNTRWLKAVGADFPTVTPPEGVWFVPDTDPNATDGISETADVRGQDTAAPSEVAFCTHVRLTQLLPTMVRAEVRVFWLRDSGYGKGQGTNANAESGTLNGADLCNADPAYVDAISDEVRRYHFVYVSSAILRNDAAS
ncbi:MAG: hypothetical protein IT373_38280 [Polyangiaceae bacterium]|nr:hypothetical protein [Polyangiaceae bacterium]